MNQPGSVASLNDWLAWLETLSPREIVLGLDRVTTVLERLDLPRPERVINVAGTNGKGSSVAMLEALLTAAGFTTGCYTSPHLVRYNERIRIGGNDATDDAVIAAFQRVQSVRHDVPLTYFEFGTLAALVAFAEAGADTLILEVGMGGRLDAVNAVEPDACLITNVSLDHTAWLGTEPEAIAAEKAAIMRAGKPAVYGTTEHAETIRAHANTIGAELRVAGDDYRFRMLGDGQWSWVGCDLELERLRGLTPAGDVQITNAAAVLALLEAMGHDELLSAETVDRAFSTLNLRGRFQLINVNRPWILDVAHNPAAAAVLAASLSPIARDSRVIAVVGMLADKDITGVITPFSESIDSWVAVPLHGSRTVPAAALAQQIANCTGKPCRIAQSIEEALETADTLSEPDTTVLVTGSFYVVGPALEWLDARRQ